MARSLGLSLPDRADDRLRRFEELLRTRAVPLGLLGESDVDRIWERHVLDSLRAAGAVRGGDRLAFDIGSGAGLPGLVVAAVCPGLDVWVVEPRRRRVAFLEVAVEDLELENVSVVPTRIEDVSQPADLCLARAFAPLPRAWRLALPHLRPTGRLVYFMGGGDALLNEARPGAGSDRDAIQPSGLAERVAALTGARSVEVLETPVLESAGPLIIMTPQ